MICRRRRASGIVHEHHARDADGIRQVWSGDRRWSVLGRPFDGIDDNHFEGALLGLQPESQLVLQRRTQRGSRRIGRLMSPARGHQIGDSA